MEKQPLFHKCIKTLKLVAMKHEVPSEFSFMGTQRSEPRGEKNKFKKVPQVDTEEDDRWSCSTVDSLGVKSQPSTASSFEISSLFFLSFSPRRAKRARSELAGRRW